METQIQGLSIAGTPCPKCESTMRRKDVHSIVYRTLFGKFTLPNERFYTCCEGHGKKSFSPLSELLSTHTHPDLVYLQSRWAALIPYEQALRLFEDVLPIEGAISLTNMKVKVPQVGQRIETDRANQVCATPVLEVPDESTQKTTSGEENIPTTTLNVGVDAGYVRSNALKGEGTRRFGVIAVKTLEDNSRCHAYVQTAVDDGDKRIVRFIEEGRDSPPASVTFLTDAGGDIKAATPLVGEANHRILDWFHLAMYFQIVLQTATPYKRWHYNALHTVFEEIERIKWRFWHGQIETGCQRLRLLAIWIGSQANTKTKEKLAIRLFELLQYAEDNADYIVNYARRYRDGLPISSSMAESAVNQIISHRFVKKQQMRWSPKGAHKLLQVRTAVLNNGLAEHFKLWYPGFATNDPVYARAA